MAFNLKKDLCFFDLEATGLNVVRDRIVQIAILKFSPKKIEPDELSMLINPGIPISEEAMQVHGLTNADLANKPTFPQVADKIYSFIGDADLAGYNSNRFDIPMLIEEFGRVGINFDMNSRRTIDVQRIFYKMEPRNLKAAMRFYCDEELVDAHDALADVRATVSVLKGQLEKYAGTDLISDDGEVIPQPVRNDIKALHEFTTDHRLVDATQRLKRDHNGEIVFNFGKYVGKPVGKTLSEDKQYLSWMLNKEFSFQVKEIIRELVSDYERNQKNG